MIRQLIPGFEFELSAGSLGDKQGLYNIDAAKRDLGYVPAVTLEAGLQEYIEWLKEHDF